MTRNLLVFSYWLFLYGCLLFIWHPFLLCMLCPSVMSLFHTFFPLTSSFSSSTRFLISTSFSFCVTHSQHFFPLFQFALPFLCGGQLVVVSTEQKGSNVFILSKWRDDDFSLLNILYLSISRFICKRGKTRRKWLGSYAAQLVLCPLNP